MGKFKDFINGDKVETNMVRGSVIHTKAKKSYEMEIANVTAMIEEHKQERDQMLDVKGDESGSTIQASKFNGQSFAIRDADLTIKIDHGERSLKLIEERFLVLFG
jgi:co-chaperonin GroES (HSP10)